MITGARYDLAHVLQPELFADEASRRAVFALALDEDLRELFVRRVSDEVPASPESFVPALVTALRCDYGHATYFVVAHMIGVVGDDIVHQVDAEDEVLRDAAALSAHHYLGRLVFDDDRLYSSADRHSFRGYPGLGYLPRDAGVDMT